MIRTNNMINNYKKYLKKIESSIKTFLNDSQVFLFGSIIEGNLVAGSDIDILIIANIPKKHLKRAELIAKIEENAGLPLSHPFEFHLLTQEELNTWIKIYNLRFEDISAYL
ncbi:MAG: nucleotidyltransferase domain-containing protein [Promethearchaeota archaeon]|nr:MAG: nucleotidyltransferase domain-containing protein [Candidatus Lokiarchaeota archaeon]